MDYALTVFSYFYKHQWMWSVDNFVMLQKSLSPLDNKNFFIDVKEISWKEFPFISWMGLRRYLLKEEDSTIPAAKTKYKM